jgi:hypothetical protein
VETTPTLTGIDTDEVIVHVPPNIIIDHLNVIVPKLIRERCGVPRNVPIEARLLRDDGSGLRIKIKMEALMNGSRADIIDCLAQAGYVEDAGLELGANI